ncbi:MAG: monoheme cytochrome SoxX [Thiobacillus sp.]
MMFDHRLILLATPRQIGVLDWRPGRMHWLGEFRATPEGLNAFHRIIARNAGLPVVLVADTVEEDYRSEILPHVQGRARAELLGRKLRQVFRNARFTGAWRQAREASGRRDDRYLLAALPDADWLTPWLGVLHREGAPLAGITPLALAYQYLLARLRTPSTHVLLACRLGNGLRLSYYHNGLLRFSRLIAGDTPTQSPGNAAEEIAKTQLYMSGQRILPREARLHVLLLDPTGQLDSAQAPLNADPAFSARAIDLATLARALHIPDDFLRVTPEVAPLAAIASEALPLNLAPADLLQPHTEFLWRRGLRAAAGVIAFLGAGMTAAYWLHAQDLSDQAARLAQQVQRLESRYGAIARTFPPDAATPEQLAQTVTLAGRLDRPQTAVDTLLATVGAALQSTPGIVLETLRWRDDSLTSGQARLEIDAALVPFQGNFRAAMQDIEGFMRVLGAVPGVTGVSLVRSPVNADSTGTLSGKTIEGSAANMPVARFSVSANFAEIAR